MGQQVKTINRKSYGIPVTKACLHIFARGQVALIPPLQIMHLVSGFQVPLEGEEAGPQMGEDLVKQKSYE